MSKTTDPSPHALLILALGGALIALAVSYSIDVEELNSPSTQTGMAVKVSSPTHNFETPTLAPSAIVLQGQLAYRFHADTVKIYFEPSKTEISLSADKALHEIALKAANAQRLKIVGFHDLTGNPSQNVVLAKRRAEAVRRRLLELGVPAKKIEMKKSSAAAESKDHAEARRVEVAFE